MTDADRAQLLDAMLEMVIAELPANCASHAAARVRLFEMKFDASSVADPGISDEQRDGLLSEVRRVLALLQARAQQAPG